ncbi:transporter substrate-binding domain-containing protein [Atopomonas sediminilitoris]|uniref:transporter substrate-binding domain-containing protein n=1 Tax=Atopomonas sediminilitoris TaxID=2919919 RepID=UPI001F4E19E5|nr:transporter substrate-binding domain-containing protein [Atopomonas sediminilitoris]MCJ8169485.1 transporter substrate-binding domain-containing protein [Atopomonas sediminilitoris]
MTRWQRVQQAALGVLLACVLVTVAQGQTVRFAPEADYGPFIYQNQQGQIAGLSLEFLEQISRNAGLTLLTLEPQPLAKIMQAVAAGDVDVVSSLRPTPERAKYLGFTAPYVQIPAVVVGRYDSSQRLDLGALGEAQVAVGEGYAVEAFVRQAYPQIQWQTVPSDSVGLKQLLNGAVDAVVMDIASVNFIASQEGMQGLLIGAPVGFDYPLSMAYRKEDQALGEALEQGLAAIDQVQRLQILQRWMPDDGVPRQEQRGLSLETLGLLTLVLAVLLGALALWHRQRRQVGM